jgi:hypothetical protein
MRVVDEHLPLPLANARLKRDVFISEMRAALRGHGNQRD